MTRRQPKQKSRENHQKAASRQLKNAKGHYLTKDQQREVILNQASQPIAMNEAEMEEEAIQSAATESQFLQFPEAVAEMEAQTEIHSSPPMEPQPEVPPGMSTSDPGPFSLNKEGQTQEDYRVPKILSEPIPEEILEKCKPQTPKIEPTTSTPTTPLPSETKNSSQESPARPPQNPSDPQFTKLVDYVLRNISQAYILAQLGAILSNAQVVPHISYWKPKEDIDIALTLHQIINQPGYIAKVYPSLKIVMGTSLSNTAWTANVLITLAFFDLIKILPLSDKLGATQ